MKHMMRGFIKRILIAMAAAGCTLAALLPLSQYAGAQTQDSAANSADQKPVITQLSTRKSKIVNKWRRDLSRLRPLSKTDQEKRLYIVQLEDKPLLAHQPVVRGQAAASQRGAAYMRSLEQKQHDFTRHSHSILGRQAEVVYHYKKAFNGLALRVTGIEAQRLATAPGVKRVMPDIERHLHTDVSPDFVGASEIWEGMATGVNAKGEGVVIGVIDTGINSDHSSFAAVGGDGYVHSNPLGNGVFLGDCVVEPSFCNNKLIGARSYPEVLAQTGASNAEDLDGHGSHTAATAAGNILFNVPMYAGTTPTGIIFPRVAGMAPHANIIAYQVCYPSDTGGCPVSAIVAAIEDAIEDGVDIINFSIGGGSNDPWVDADSIAFKNARAAGVFVATSAGNDGPGAETLGSPADAPWITAVANSTHNRGFVGMQLTGFNGGDTSPPADIDGSGATGGLEERPIVFAGDFGDALCSPGAFAAGTFNGEIVVCNRGDFALVDKAQSVASGGAGGVIIANTPSANGQLFSLAYVIPGMQINLANGNALRTWLASGSGHRGAITGAQLVLDDNLADRLALSSSRGPNASVPGLLSPSVAAPGSDVYAAYRDPENFSFLNGTSMASPHVAGSAALLRQLHPNWTAAETHSALMTTATPIMLKEDGVTPADPFDYGSGRIRVDLAANAGLLLHETDSNFSSADPAIGGDPASLNLPGLQSNQCLGSCTWQRRVKATRAGTWIASSINPPGMQIDVQPESFTLGVGEIQTLTITASNNSAPVGQFHFGRVILTPNLNGVPTTELPVAVKPSSGILPETIDIVASRDAGSVLIRDLQAREITQLHADIEGLNKAQRFALSLRGDSNNSDPFDDLNDGVLTRLFNLPANATRFVALTRDSESPDLDLFVGIDSNDDGLATEDELVCVSATASAAETCDLSVADDSSHAWWVHVQNWQASAPDAEDAFSLLVGIVKREARGNLHVEAPTYVPELTPFDMRVFWDINMHEGDVFFGNIILGSDPARPGNIGTIPVMLERGADDVGFSVSQNSARVGDTLSFSINIAPNFTPEDRRYQIAARVPEGLRLLENSISDGGLVFGRTVFWDITQESLQGAEGQYVISTSDQDSACIMPFTSGGYLDLAAFGIGVDPLLGGDNENYGAFSGQDPVAFFGTPIGGGLVINTNGYISFGDVVSGANNTAIPDAALPNGIIAPFWDDLEVVIDAANGRGVTLASAGPNMTFVEFDDVQRIEEPEARFDFEVALLSAIDDSPGAYEIRMAYDNLQGSLNSATVGVENVRGSSGTQYLFNNGNPQTLHDDLVVCYDYVGPDTEARILHFQAEVDNAFTEVRIKQAKFIDNSPLWWWPRNNLLWVSGDLSRAAQAAYDGWSWLLPEWKLLSLYNADTGELLAQTHALVLSKASGKQHGVFAFLLKNLPDKRVPCRVRVAIEGQDVQVQVLHQVDNPGSRPVLDTLEIQILSDDQRDVSGVPDGCSI